MALLAEEIVEEWLNRQGYFTIRGAKVGRQEIDLLAIKINGNDVDCRHLEVTASINPASYISSVPKEIQEKTHLKPANAKKRTREELQLGIQEWVEKKFNLEKKNKLRQQLCPGNWSYELVVHKVRSSEELELFKKAGIKVHHLREIVSEMADEKMMIKSASGGSLVDLVLLEFGD